MNDSEFASRRRILRAQLAELEGRAGLALAAVDRPGVASSMPYRPARDSLGGETQADESPPSPSGDGAERSEVRRRYFGVSAGALRRALIAKQREVALFERTQSRVLLEDARAHLDAIRRRPSEGWWLAAIVGATLVIVGYWLFALIGAFAGGVAALFVGSGIEQAARRRFAEAIASAQEDVRSAERVAAAHEQAGEIFSERESASGEPDRVSGATSELNVRAPSAP